MNLQEIKELKKKGKLRFSYIIDHLQLYGHIFENNNI